MEFGFKSGFNAAPKGGYSEEDMKNAMVFAFDLAADPLIKAQGVYASLSFNKCAVKYLQSLKPQYKPTVTFIDGVLQVDHEGFVIVK